MLPHLCFRIPRGLQIKTKHFSSLHKVLQCGTNYTSSGEAALHLSDSSSHNKPLLILNWSVFCEVPMSLFMLSFLYLLHIHPPPKFLLAYKIQLKYCQFICQTSKHSKGLLPFCPHSNSHICSSF